LTLASNRGDVDLNVTYTDNGNVNADGWNLVGNPYPSAIVWDGNLTNWDIQDLEPIVYVPDVANPDYFMSYDYSTGLGVPGLGTLDGGVIASGQAFWVKAQGPGLNPNLAVHESAKTSASGEFYRKAHRENNNGLSITLSDQVGKDVSWLMVRSDALNGYDPKYDRSKLLAPVLSVSFVAEGRNLVNSTIKDISNTTIPISVYASHAGDVTISFEKIGTMPEFDELFLVDRQSGQSHKISSGSYTFTSIGEMETSDRFYLSSQVEGDLRVNVYPNPVIDLLTVKVYTHEATTITILDMTGKVVARDVIERSNTMTDSDALSATFDLGNFQRGIYIVNTQFEGNYVIKKIIKN
jgi:hypothetical protein